VLTAGHDVAKLQAPSTIDVSRRRPVTPMNGALSPCRRGHDHERRARCVLLDHLRTGHRSPISSETSDVLYVAYAPAGVPAEAVEAQLRRIEENIRLFSPALVVEQRRVLSLNRSATPHVLLPRGTVRLKGAEATA